MARILIVWHRLAGTRTAGRGRCNCVRRALRLLTGVDIHPPMLRLLTRRPYFCLSFLILISRCWCCCAVCRRRDWVFAITAVNKVIMCGRTGGYEWGV